MLGSRLILAVSDRSEDIGGWWLVGLRGRTRAVWDMFRDEN